MLLFILIAFTIYYQTITFSEEKKNLRSLKLYLRHLVYEKNRAFRNLNVNCILVLQDTQEHYNQGVSNVLR